MCCLLSNFILCERQYIKKINMEALLAKWSRWKKCRKAFCHKWKGKQIHNQGKDIPLKEHKTKEATNSVISLNKFSANIKGRIKYQRHEVYIYPRNREEIKRKKYFLKIHDKTRGNCNQWRQQLLGGSQHLNTFQIFI